MKQFQLGLLLILTSVAFGATAEPARIRIDSGMLVGETVDGVSTFRGIPFAKPPVGDRRWAAPERVDKWRGDRAATGFAPPCPQPTDPDGKSRNGGGVSGATSEDCLYLNVIAPEKARKAPVMVWFHGGAFFLGAGSLGSYNAPAFARSGVVIVTVNYRLGPLGFFAHPALLSAAGDSAKINYTLMDAVAALQWVQRNIKQFGGDPKNVTAFGQSAGGFLVMDLLGSPAAKGLFSKAGVESGAALVPATPIENAMRQSVEWATRMGLDGENATLAELRAVPVERFTASSELSRSPGSPPDGIYKVKSTKDAFEDGTANYVPLLIGSNNGERGFNGARAVATAMSKVQSAFLYQFAYVPEWRAEAQPNGAPHSAEIVYVFNSWDTTSLPVDGVQPIDREVADRVHSCWVAFAKATPGATSLDCADGYTWPRFNAQYDQATRFGTYPEVVKSQSIADAPPPGSPRGSMAPN